MRTILLQSHRAGPLTRWILSCLDSAAEWAAANRIERRFIHDELFEGLPEDFIAATAAEILPRTDLGRLRWIKRLHGEGWDRVIWLDADILIFDQSLSFTGDALGREAWIAPGLQGGFRALRKVNNAVLCFDRGSARLARYIAVAEALAARMAAGDTPVTRMALGPDILTRLHVETPFPLHPDVGMISPCMMAALVSNDPAPLRVHLAVWGGAPKAVNLCGSLSGDGGIVDAAIGRLRADPNAMRPEGRPAEVEELRPWKDAPPVW